MNVSLLHSGSLLGQYFLGHRFYRGQNTAWTKVDGLRLGVNSEIFDGPSYDIGRLLDRLVQNPNVTVVSYDWKSQRVFIGSAFDLNDPSDTIQNQGFTTYVKRRRAVYAGNEPHTLLTTPRVSITRSRPNSLLLASRHNAALMNRQTIASPSFAPQQQPMKHSVLIHLLLNIRQ